MNTSKNFRSLISLILSLFIIFCALPVSSYADPEPQAADPQAHLSELQTRRAQLVYQINAVSSKVEELKQAQADVLEQKVAMDERDAYILEQLTINEETQALYRDMIAKKSEELEEAKSREAEQLRRYRSRVRVMEENGEFGYLDIFMNCRSLADILTSVDDIGEIMESDRNLEKKYIAAREKTETVKAEYEAVEREVTAKIEELQAEQEALRAKIQEALDLINSLEGDISNYYTQWQIMLGAHAAACAEIDSIARQLAAERAAAAAASPAANFTDSGSTGASGSTPYGYNGSAVQGTGNFTWPLGSNLVTSEFGNRNAPTAGATSNHQGLDINAHEGDPIWAADGGTVAAAGYNSGYGNYVLIDHGNGYSTLYAHLSTTNVTKGQTVTQGETIGGAGHSGVATGDHLHLEIRQNGQQIDPTSVFSTGLDYSYLYGH